ncbi:MAG TPA: EF-P lysine aminoacylase EpmA [Pseudomonadota bacterium]|nr:EF-P lysine aminoacylase EpmA [Pseudomonadota bacterium]
MSASLRGRLIEVSARSLLVDTGDSMWRLTVACDVSSLCAGDFIAVHADPVSVTDSIGVAQNVTLLARPQGTGQPFPSPGGDYFRLNCDRRRHLLSLRALALASIRNYFAAHDFLEIEAPLIVPSPGLELHLQGFSVAASDGKGPPRYLITSPEYQLKRLLTSGLTRIYSLGKVFRSGESGPFHNPEFTMLEFYRAYEGWQSVATDVAALAERLATEIHGSPRFVRHVEGIPQTIDLSLPWQTHTVASVVKTHAGIDLRGDETVDELRDKIAVAGFRIPSPSRTDSAGNPYYAWDDLFFSMFLDQVEPKLMHAGEDGIHRPIVLCDWPAPLCALARKRPDNPAVVERFEAYVAGLELCNGFGELCDPVEQRQRFLKDQQERRVRDLPQYPLDERFLSALAEGMPPAGGVALGIDRLLMLILDAPHIRDVLAFGVDEL